MVNEITDIIIYPDTFELVLYKAEYNHSFDQKLVEDSARRNKSKDMTSDQMVIYALLHTVPRKPTLKSINATYPACNWLSNASDDSIGYSSSELDIESTGNIK